MRSKLTLYYGEAKEVQLFDSKKLCHTIENILPCGLRLEQEKRHRSPYSTCIHCSDKENFDCLGESQEDRLRHVTVNTDPDSDVQLVFVGEKNTNISLLLY